MNEEFDEYIIFTVTDKDGNEVEMAVVDEFEYDHKEYVAAAQVEGDELIEDGDMANYVYEEAQKAKRNAPAVENPVNQRKSEKSKGGPAV